MAKKLDTFGIAYDLTTQRQVSLLIAAPIVVGAIGLGVNYGGLTGASIMGVPLITLPFWVMNAMVRENGKAYARKHNPNGIPSTQALRASVVGFAAADRRQRIQAITGVKLASKSSEAANPQDADAKIVRAVDDLRAKLRSHRDSSVLRRELKSYGFWRNMVGNRPLGIITSIFGSLLAAYAVGHTWEGVPTIALLICIISLLFWMFYVTHRRYTVAGERYSDELFRSMSYLEKEK